MTLNMTIGTEFFNNVFNNTIFFGSEYIITGVILIMTLAIITRDIDDWKILFLPVYIGWMQMGMHMSYAFFIIALVLFVLESLSMKAMSSVITGVMSSFGKARDIGQSFVDLRQRIRLGSTESGKRKLRLERKQLDLFKKRESFKKQHGIYPDELQKMYGEQKALKPSDNRQIGKAEAKTRVKKAREKLMNLINTDIDIQKKLKRINEERIKAGLSPYLLRKKKSRVRIKYDDDY